MAPDAHSTQQTIHVDLGARGYDIVIGDDVVGQAGERIRGAFGDARIAIISDETVDGLHGAALRTALSTASLDSATILVPPGETSKSFSTLENVVDAVLAHGFERGDVVLALGGGVVGDLAGFAAGIVRRGMGFVQMPTTLLAQVDSSVGGKTGINSPRGKNLVGLFNQPALVLADTSLLDTLSDREMRAGYAEVAKYGLIDRPDFFRWLEVNYRRVFAGGAARARAVAVSCQAKADVVKADEFEGGQRALLNLGHTFGHALEAAVGYDPQRLVHGEGVAIGMVLAHQFSHHLNHCGPEPAERVIAHLRKVGLPTSIGEIAGDAISVETLMAAVAQDKKVKRGALTFILTKGIGEAFVAHDVPSDAVRSFLEKKCDR
ncbi:MAG: 3-dehydroquinate synthase [Ahrensia sp.]|nr:3-dehydroquinate synthase [Ahrensia sp.]